MMPADSDVSAVVLCLGEPTTELALAALARQTMPPAETIMVRDVRPFHRAINDGVARVTTPYFVQVDADMILDPDCFAQLRTRMRPRMGEVLAMLRDPLIGMVMGVKLYRTECFRQAAMPDSISPDTDHYQSMRARGWKVTLARRGLRTRLSRALALGDHLPSYTLEYTYHKYLLEGRRYYYRKSHLGIRWHFAKLEQSKHPSALIAQIGLAHGMFLDAANDLLGRSEFASDNFADLERFLGGEKEPSPHMARPPVGKVSQELYDTWLNLGRSLYGQGNSRAVNYLVRQLASTRGDDSAWIAKIGLLRGLDSQASRRDPAQDFSMLRDFLTMTDPEMPPLLRGIGAFNQRLRRLYAARRASR